MPLRNSGLRDDLEKRLTSALDDVVVNGGDAPRTGQHLNIRFEGVRNQELLIRLDRAGVAASAGSACQSGAAKVSHVLVAMGLTPDEARQSVRLSLGWNTTADDVITAADTIVELVEELR